jgi:predicted transcriptional regulator
VEKTKPAPKEVFQMIEKEGVSPIRARRSHLGLSQIELARRADVDQGSLSKMERTKMKSRTETLKKLAAAVELPENQPI